MQLEPMDNVEFGIYHIERRGNEQVAPIGVLGSITVSSQVLVEAVRKPLKAYLNRRSDFERVGSDLAGHSILPQVISAAQQYPVIGPEPEEGRRSSPLTTDGFEHDTSYPLLRFSGAQIGEAVITNNMTGAQRTIYALIGVDVNTDLGRVVPADQGLTVQVVTGTEVALTAVSRHWGRQLPTEYTAELVTPGLPKIAVATLDNQGVTGLQITDQVDFANNSMSLAVVEPLDYL